MNLDDMNLDEESVKKISAEMLQFFADDPYPAIVTSEGGVEVSMDTRYQVCSVKLGKGETANIERAIMDAMNKATKAVTERNALRLAQAMSKQKS